MIFVYFFCFGNPALLAPSRDRDACLVVNIIIETLNNRYIEIEISILDERSLVDWEFSTCTFFYSETCENVLQFILC